MDKKGIKCLLKIKNVLNLHPHSSAIGLWCNGNTTVFGAVFQGSSPCRPTVKMRNPCKNNTLQGLFFCNIAINIVIWIFSFG